jgi:Rieske [2Fe-2S] domain
MTTTQHRGDDLRRIRRASDFSQAVCDEELRQIFADSWLFIGHESEIPQAGDYVTRRMGDDDVIMCRAKSGDVRVLPNSCAHRGTQLCRSDDGDQLVLNPLREQVIRGLGPTAPSGGYGRTACEEATMPGLIGGRAPNSSVWMCVGLMPVAVRASCMAVMNEVGPHCALERRWRCGGPAAYVGPCAVAVLICVRYAFLSHPGATCIASSLSRSGHLHSCVSSSGEGKADEGD